MSKPARPENRLPKKPTQGQSKKLARFRRIIAGLRVEIRQLKARVTALEERLGQTSQNSSMSPSSDPPSVAPAPPHVPTGRNPGGQPKHRKHERKLLPPERVHKTIPVKPERCKKCRHPLQGVDPKPLRHQVIDLPPVEPLVTEYPLHALACDNCQTVTQAALPAGVPRGNFSSRVVAIASLLTSYYRLGRRTAAEAMMDLFGVTVHRGVASICAISTSA